MRMLWKFLKIVLGLALAIPLAIIILATAVGVLGALVGLAFMVLKLAVLGLICWGVFRVVAALLRPTPKPQPYRVGELPPVDPHYEAAMRELDRELGDVRK